MATFKWDCWKRPKHHHGRWDAFHWREPLTLAEEVKRERAATARTQRDPLPTPYWLQTRKPTLSGIVKGLAWTCRLVSDPGENGEYATHYNNCTEWLKARRAARGLSNK